MANVTNLTCYTKVWFWTLGNQIRRFTTDMNSNSAQYLQSLLDLLPCWKMDSVTEVTSSNRALMGGKWSVSLAKICTIWNSRTSNQTLAMFPCKQESRLLQAIRQLNLFTYICLIFRLLPISRTYFRTKSNKANFIDDIWHCCLAQWIYKLHNKSTAFFLLWNVLELTCWLAGETDIYYDYSILVHSCTWI